MSIIEFIKQVEKKRQRAGSCRAFYLFFDKFNKLNSTGALM